jgi:Cys-tRNA synthase (O-phospho-L-seryl-tRNA:Cys-tRNA synthase)
MRGMNGKIDELIISLHNQVPNVMCTTEHHLIDYEIDSMHIAKHKRGAKFIRSNLKNGGYIYIQKGLTFSTINLQRY